MASGSFTSLIWSVAVDLARSQFATPVPLFPAHIPADTIVSRLLAVTRDGSRILVSRDNGAARGDGGSCDDQLDGCLNTAMSQARDLSVRSSGRIVGKPEVEIRTDPGHAPHP